MTPLTSVLGCEAATPLWKNLGHIEDFVKIDQVTSETDLHQLRLLQYYY